MKQSSVSRIEKLIEEALMELEALKNQPVLTRDETRKLVRKQKREYTEFTRLLQKKYEEKGHTFDSLAKKLDITPGFARHVIYSDYIPLSMGLVDRLATVYKISPYLLRKKVEARNRIGHRYRQKHKWPA